MAAIPAAYIPSSIIFTMIVWMGNLTKVKTKQPMLTVKPYSSQHVFDSHVHAHVKVGSSYCNNKDGERHCRNTDKQCSKQKNLISQGQFLLTDELQQLQHL